MGNKHSEWTTSQGNEISTLRVAFTQLLYTLEDFCMKITRLLTQKPRLGYK